MAEASSRPVVSFSVGFREDEANELPDARRVAEALRCEHHELELSVTENAIEFDELAWHLDEPVADISALGLVLCHLASEHVTLALAGQGADELFGGYTSIEPRPGSPTRSVAAATRDERAAPDGACTDLYRGALAYIRKLQRPRRRRGRSAELVVIHSH
jgi:asparagine synthetase B (glutamine-hydrolysing)